MASTITAATIIDMISQNIGALLFESIFFNALNYHTSEEAIVFFGK